jgi:LPS export ABC transporter protein LptC
MTQNRKIDIMKKLNLLLILLIFAAIMIFVHTGGYNERVRLVAENSPEKKEQTLFNDEVYIKRPTLHQYNAKKGQYTITADEGIQNKKLEIISLNKLTMDYLDPAQEYWFRVTAGKGELSMHNKRVEATDAVIVYALMPNGDSVNISADRAIFEQEKSTISIPSPITLTSVIGTLSASTMTQVDNIITFTGPVKIKLFL